MGLAGHVAAAASVDLEEIGEKQTAIKYITEVGLTGKLGGLGQPVFRATSAKVAKEFGVSLKAEIEGGGTGPRTGSAA
jgi:carbon monoxide dehydrogenase subunit G